jgi:hypothetical protein
VNEINALSKQVQDKVVAAFGLTADAKFVRGKAAVGAD